MGVLGGISKKEIPVSVEVGLVMWDLALTGVWGENSRL
jgi:hypothetical protein